MVITNITTIWASHSIDRCKSSNNSANSLKTSICNKNIAYIMIHHTTSCASKSILWYSWRWHYDHNMIDHVHHHYITQHHVNHRAFNHIIDKILSTWNIMRYLVHHRASYHFIDTMPTTWYIMQHLVHPRHTLDLTTYCASLSILSPKWQRETSCYILCIT